MDRTPSSGRFFVHQDHPGSAEILAGGRQMVRVNRPCGGPRRLGQHRLDLGKHHRDTIPKRLN
jgi:hypothetical protein